MQTATTPTSSPADTLIRSGAIVAVRVGFDAGVQAGRMPALPAEIRRALIDTGSQINCIDATLARSLNLPLIQSRQIAHVGGTSATQTCRAQIFFVDSGIVQTSACALVDNLDSDGRQVALLIGRAGLANFSFHYDGVAGLARLLPITTAP